MASLKPVSDANRELIESFTTKYNAIDHQLRDALDRDLAPPFSAVLAEATKRQLVGRTDAEVLRVAGELRNILTHAKTVPHGYPAVPTTGIVEALDRIYSTLRHPLLAIPAFKRNVETVAPSDSLTSVLARVRKCDYSQFPVYEAADFRGLLTENGITRWLADHLASEVSLVDCDDVSVERLLRKEEARRLNCRFLPRDATVSEIQNHFAAEQLLEAVLITHAGKKSERLLGIATRWDLLRVKHGD